MNSIKVVGIRWPSSIDVSHKRIILPEVENSASDGTALTKMVENMLYDRHFNQCLLRWENVLYVCDRNDEVKRDFFKTKVEYHPYISYLD
jgi:hypothetical protein